MSIHRLLMRLFPAFCLGKALNGNVKHFVFDLTYDVTGDLEVKFLNLIWKISSRPFHCRLNFFPTSVGFRDRWGGAIRPPPPQQRVGSGLGPAGRGLTWAGHEIDLTSCHEYEKNQRYTSCSNYWPHQLLKLWKHWSQLWLWQGVKFDKLRFEVTSLNVTWRPDLL